jgi:hypothetical protein
MPYQFPGRYLNISLQTAPVDIVLKNRYDPKILINVIRPLGRTKKKKVQN